MQLKKVCICVYLGERHSSCIVDEHIYVAKFVQNFFEGAIVFLENRDVVRQHEDIVTLKVLGALEAFGFHLLELVGRS